MKKRNHGKQLYKVVVITDKDGIKSVVFTTTKREKAYEYVRTHLDELHHYSTYYIDKDVQYKSIRDRFMYEDEDL